VYVAHRFYYKASGQAFRLNLGILCGFNYLPTFFSNRIFTLLQRGQMQEVPLDVVGHICSFLPLWDVIAFACSSKQCLKQFKTESFIQQCKDEFFFSRWKL